MPERERETIVTNSGGGGGAIAAVIAVIAVVAIVLFVFGGTWFGGGSGPANVTMETPAPDVNVQAPDAPDIEIETGSTAND
jgi:hypothetical protein